MCHSTMKWLNFHHLCYFWIVAESVRKAAEQLHISQSWISDQRTAGQLVLSYADEIFSMGRELMSAVKQRPGTRARCGSTSA